MKKVILVLLVLAGTAEGHALGPASLQIDEEAGTARFQAPTAAGLVVRWPPGCEVTPIARRVEGANTIEDLALRCAAPLEGSVIGVDGLAARDTIAIVRVRMSGGRVAREILGPTHPELRVPAETTWPHVLGEHVRLGIEHLLGGFDHLLFVLGLLLVVPGLRARAVTLTAFTAGHSATLALAVLGIVQVPAAPVEIAIALTIVVLALQAVDGRPARHGWPLAAAFGLVHGLGFAGALTGAGLPADDIPLALAGFNVGIELGQLAAAAALVGIGVLARRAGPHGRTATAYAIGALAAMWCLERTAALF